MTVTHSRVAAGCLGGARGWNADQFGRRFVPAPSTAAPRGVVWKRVGVGWVVVGTLLGPEGAGDRCLVGAGLFLVPLTSSAGGWGSAGA